jgi:hypothetical protein
MEIFYSGIGSRNTPEKVLIIMEKLGTAFAQKNFVLRSGHAEGADMAFEKGCDRANGKKEIYIPWKNFNNSQSTLYYENLPEKATDLAFEFHPNLHRCNYGTIKLMARNTCQILGLNCETPSSFVVCYTSDGKFSGGTGQALRIADHSTIPIFNLFNQTDLDRLKNFAQEIAP